MAAFPASRTKFLAYAWLGNITLATVVFMLLPRPWDVCSIFYLAVVSFCAKFV